MQNRNCEGNEMVNVCPDSLHIMHRGKIIREEYHKPFQKGMLHRMFSVAKSYTAIAIGALISEEKLCMEDTVCTFFPEYLPEEFQEAEYDSLRRMTIEDLLTMRTCHATTTYKKHPERNWTESFFITKPDHLPGMIFHYDTSAALVLAGLVRKISGKSVLDYLRDVFLDQIGFSKDAYFTKDPFGADNGGSGMMAYPEDLLVTGKFLVSVLNGKLQEEYPELMNANADSVYNGEFFVRFEKFLKEAMRYHSSTIHEGKTRSERAGYGYMFWMLPKGGIMMYGMGGQYLILYPKEELVIVTTADAQSEAGGTQGILDMAEYEILPSYKESDPDSDRNDKIPGFSFENYIGKYRIGKKGSVFEGFSVEENEFRLRKKEEEYRFLFSLGNYGTEFEIKECSHNYAKAELQPDGSLYIRVRLMGESFGALHILIRKKEKHTLLFLRKVEEYALPEFNGFFDAERIK